MRRLLLTIAVGLIALTGLVAKAVAETVVNVEAGYAIEGLLDDECAPLVEFGELLVVEAEVVNEDDRPRDLRDLMRSLQVEDAEGRRFDLSYEATVTYTAWTEVESFEPFERLQPTEARELMLVFEVADAESGPFRLLSEVGDEMISEREVESDTYGLASRWRATLVGIKSFSSYLDLSDQEVKGNFVGVTFDVVNLEDAPQAIPLTTHHWCLLGDDNTRYSPAQDATSYYAASQEDVTPYQREVAPHGEFRDAVVFDLPEGVAPLALVTKDGSIVIPFPSD